MAKKEEKNNSSIVSRLINTVQQNIGGIYKDTYMNNNDTNNQINGMKTNINKSIDKLLNTNIDNIGQASISKVYERLNKQNKSNGLKLENLFDDRAITDSLMLNASADTSSIREYDEEIDIVCKNMPQLEDALTAKKDNVLSADHFSKDFLNCVNSSNSIEEKEFYERIDTIKSKYRLVEQLERAYDNTSKYGEQFVYIVPYKEAFQKLLGAKNINTGGVGYSTIREAEEILESSIENIVINLENGKIISNTMVNSEKDNILNESKLSGSINLRINTTGILESVIKEKKIMEKTLNNNNVTIKNDDLEFNFKSKNNTSMDGLIDTDAYNKVEDIKVPGCVFKLLERDKIIPIYIDKVCLGYYYIEFSNLQLVTDKRMTTTPMFNSNNMKNGAGGVGSLNTNQTDDRMLMYLANQLSTAIDTKFINANTDLSSEIYMLLKANKIYSDKMAANINATFIPSEHIEHVVFNMDEKTNRGISDLDRSLIPAKLYTGLYVGNTIGILTRGQDKRVYYVKQNIDTNISQTLLNTLSQIKKGNFGARELVSVKNVLGVSGRYNDYVIPVGNTGDAPIQFEVMPGQNIDPKMDLLEQLEAMAIGPTDVPIEYIQSRKQVEFATKLTMSSGRFVRVVFKRQAKVEYYFSKIMTKLYDYEYDSTDIVKIQLPPPAYLNLVDTLQLMNNVNEQSQAIADMEFIKEEDEEVKKLYISRLKQHYLSTYLDTAAIKNIKEKTIIEYNRDKKAEENQEG